MNVRVSKTKWTSIAIKIVTAMMLFCLLMAGVRSAQAAVSITAPTLNISTASFPSAYFTLGDIVIDEGANGDFSFAAQNTNYFFTIHAPANFEFLATSGIISAIAGDITSCSMSLSATQIVVTYSSDGSNVTQRSNDDDIITISGLQVRAITGPATQTATKSASSEIINGLNNGTVLANLSSSLLSGCTHTITLTDTYGDGWNGGTVDVTVNGVTVLSGITLAAGAGPENHTFNADNGDVIVITRTVDGTYPAEMRVEITGGSANTLLAQQEPVAAGTTVMGCCAPTVPNLANYVSPLNAAVNQSACGIILDWDAPASNGCNTATGYDISFGTSASPPWVGYTTSTEYATGVLNPSTTYYWKVVPVNSVGYPLGVMTYSFTTGATTCAACMHTIRLTDTYGDGWNGGTITVTVNGVLVLTNITLAGLSGPEDFAFNAASGDIINVTRTADGSFPSEMQVEILSGGGTILLATTTPLVAPGTVVTGCCPSVLPGCASVPLPVNGESLVNPCSVDLAWTAPAASGCEGASSYDIYFGTTASPAFLTNISGTSFVFPYALSDNTTYYWKIVPKNSLGSATGCSTWSFSTSSSPNPVYCLYGSAINYPDGGTNCAQMTDDLNAQNGCVWNRGTFSFASAFDYTINMYFGNNTGGADGCAFVFQNSPLGISTCGNNGSQLGAGGIPNSLIIEFDTYDNDGTESNDLAVDHVAIEIDGDLPDDPANLPANAAPLCGPVQADPLDAYIDDGLMHALRVTWDPATKDLCVYVDGSQRLCCNHDFINSVFGGNPNVYWGFTGATGGLTNQQYFCPISIPLPVEMMDLKADCNNNKRILTWYTASETNNHFFTIERSEDGEKFDTISRVNGAGNTNEVIMYQFIDNNASGSNIYYRVSQTDFDGRSTLLGTTEAECGDDVRVLKVVSVDHRNAGVTLNFSTGKSGMHQILLCDIHGKIIEQTSMVCEPGFNQADFCKKTDPGIYFFRILNSAETVSYKCKL
ncbi:MAG: hypothetical protein AB7V36_01770 [Bacteroidales bacterium]